MLEAEGSAPVEEAFMDCCVCDGRSCRERRSAASKTCKAAFCRRTHTQREADRRASLAPPASQALAGKRGRPAAAADTPRMYAALLKTMQCFSIDEVCGFCDFDPVDDELDDASFRSGHAVQEREYFYRIRGGFAKSIRECPMPGTRWVELNEILENCVRSDVAKLKKFDGALPARMAEICTGRLAELALAETEDEHAAEDSAEDEDDGTVPQDK